MIQIFCHVPAFPAKNYLFEFRTLFCSAAQITPRNPGYAEESTQHDLRQHLLEPASTIVVSTHNVVLTLFSEENFDDSTFLCANYCIRDHPCE